MAVGSMESDYTLIPPEKWRQTLKEKLPTIAAFKDVDADMLQYLISEDDLKWLKNELLVRLQAGPLLTTRELSLSMDKSNKKIYINGWTRQLHPISEPLSVKNIASTVLGDSANGLVIRLVRTKALLKFFVPSVEYHFTSNLRISKRLVICGRVLEPHQITILSRISLMLWLMVLIGFALKVFSNRQSQENHD
jgi:hypothetical protein